MRRLPLGVCMQLNQAELPACKAFHELDYVVIKTETQFYGSRLIDYDP